MTTPGICSCGRGHSGKRFLADEAENPQGRRHPKAKDPACLRGQVSPGKCFLADEQKTPRAAGTLKQKIRPAFGKQATGRLMVETVELPRLRYS